MAQILEEDECTARNQLAALTLPSKASKMSERTVLESSMPSGSASPNLCGRESRSMSSQTRPASTWDCRLASSTASQVALSPSARSTARFTPSGGRERVGRVPLCDKNIVVHATRSSDLAIPWIKNKKHQNTHVFHASPMSRRPRSMMVSNRRSSTLWRASIIMSSVPNPLSAQCK